VNGDSIREPARGVSGPAAIAYPDAILEDMEGRCYGVRTAGKLPYVALRQSRSSGPCS
jgi:hypothetical protein